MASFDAIEFYRAFYPDPIKPGRLWLRTRTRRNGSEHSYWCYGLREAARLTQKYRKTRDLYFGVALQDANKALSIARQRRGQATASSVRGTEVSVTAVPALWARVPLADSGAAAARARSAPPDRPAAYSLLEALPPPSVAISTGRAICFYWLLDQLWVLETEGDLASARNLLGRLQWALESRAAERGWWIEPDGDLARLLRLPAGTKQDSSLTLERFPLGAGDVRYRREDFADLPESPPLAERPGFRERPGLREQGRREGQEPCDFSPMQDGCSFLRACFADSIILDKKRWRAALTLIGLCADGRERAHDLSSPHPGYDEYATDGELARAMRASHGPRTCEFFAHRLGGLDEHCGRCPHFGKIESPADLGRRGVPAEVPAESLSGPPPVEKGDSIPADGGGRGSASPSGDPCSFSPSSSWGGLQITITTFACQPDDRASGSLARGEPRAFEVGGVRVEVVAPRPGVAGEGDASDRLLAGLENLLSDLGGSATGHQIVEALAADEDRFVPLRRTLREHLPRLEPDQLPTPRELGYLLRGLTGRSRGGLTLVRERKVRGAVVWSIRRAAAVAASTSGHPRGELRPDHRGAVD